MIIKADIDKLQTAASAMNTVTRKLWLVELDISTQARGNQILGGLGTPIQKSIINVKDRVGNCNKSLKDLMEAIEKIASEYQDAEKSSLDMFINRDMKIYESKQLYCVERTSASNEEKQKYIDFYEKRHPDEARKLREFLGTGEPNSLSENDIMNIKYLAYTAPSPFAFIYLNAMGDFAIGKTNVKGAYYSPSENTVNYNYPNSFLNDPRGPYTTFFHETGHGIDYTANLTNKESADTENFMIYSDKLHKKITLRDAIEYDVYYNKDNPHSITSLAKEIKNQGGSGKDGNIDNVIRAMKQGSNKGLSKEDKKLYNAVKNKFNNSTPNGEEFEAVSDVYGGVSGNELRNGYGHENSYWKNNPSGPGKELWAEYFSYNMAGDSQNLSNLNKYFPESSKVLEAYAYSLAGG